MMIILNLVIFYFIGLYLVRMNDRISGMIQNLAEIVIEQSGVMPPTQAEETAKTWDQKYEEEIESFTKRLRQTSGLVDLEGNASYAAPPAPNPRNADGLTIRDR